jgi:hypothetical protein
LRHSPVLAGTVETIRSTMRALCNEEAFNIMDL